LLRLWPNPDSSRKVSPGFRDSPCEASAFVNFKHELPFFIERVLPLLRQGGFAKFLRPQRALLSTPAVALHPVNVLL